MDGKAEITITIRIATEHNKKSSNSCFPHKRGGGDVATWEFLVQVSGLELKNTPIHILNNCEIPPCTYNLQQNHNQYIYV